MFVYKHYENKPIQIYWKFYQHKNVNFQIKKVWYLSYFCSKHRLWVLVRTASMFLSRNKKDNVYPCKPLFYYIKVGFKGVNIIWACFGDGFFCGHFFYFNGKKCTFSLILKSLFNFKVSRTSLNIQKMATSFTVVLEFLNVNNFLNCYPNLNKFAPQCTVGQDIFHLRYILYQYCLNLQWLEYRWLVYRTWLELPFKSLVNSSDSSRKRIFRDI